MIFATVGTQEPFPRLMRYLDNIAGRHGLEIIGQIGKDNSVYSHIQTVKALNQAEFKDAIQNCSVIVGHAGIGTILSAQQQEKPLIICPRIAAKEEHLSDHQLWTVRQIKDLVGIYVAETEAELQDFILESGSLMAAKKTRSQNLDTLISFLSKEFLAALA